MKATTKDRLKMLATSYTLPLIMAILFLTKDITANETEVSAIGLMVIGFVFGMMIEGFLVVLFGTFAIISGKLD